ncbi:MAG: hypothetical protein NTV62_01405, partial [Candidatus Gribaldobacteria bacterium]|nr:hypothetical protein [Candidatus Gribaldobacteria bacterium]
FTIVKSGDYDGEYKQKLLNITHDNGSYQNSYSQCHRVIEWNKRCARLLNLNGDNGAVYPAIEAVSYFKASIEWREMFKNLPYPLDKSRHYFDVSEIIVDGNIYKVHYVYSQAYGAEIVAVLATTKAPVTVVFEVRRPVQIDKDGEQITYFYDLPSYTSEFDWMLNHYLKEVVMKK